jgi:hypothetical protein
MEMLAGHPVMVVALMDGRLTLAPQPVAKLVVENELLELGGQIVRTVRLA